jgi:hypothetical protein
MSLNLLDQVEQTLAPTKVGIVEFAESSDYCNKRLYPRQATLLKIIFLEELTGAEEDVLDYWIAGGRNGTEITISPNIRERMSYLRENGYSHFREVDLVGGRRSSKGFVTGLAMAKVLWDCLQLQDPGEHYGIDSEKDIYFSCVAGSEQQAKEFQYADLSSTIETCRAMEPYLVKSLETEIRIATSTDLRKISQAKARGNRIQKDIARLRGKALAANAGTLRGSATMAICIDEMAHMIPGESKAAADQVYNASDPSLDQFGLDGIMFCNSSPYTKVGMFYERYQASLIPFDPSRPIDEEVDPEEGEVASNGNPRTMTFQYPSWALFEGYQGSKHNFKRAITVSPDWDPEAKTESGEYVWSEQDQKAIRQARSKEADNPETYKVERRGKFAEVTDAFLNPTMVDRMFMGTPHEWVYETPGDTIPKLHYNPLGTNWGQGALNSYRYKFHVDPSSTTAGFGFGIGHTEMFDRWDGGVEEHVVFDIIKRWNPKDFPGGVIRWDPILDEIFFYADLFRPFEITFDQHQSAEPIQLLQERLQARNIATRVYEKFATNELNWKRWEVFKTALYQGLVHGPYDTEDTHWCAQELKFLQQNSTSGKFPRVDRQEIGPVQTKDMADCVSEITHSLIGNLMVNRMRDRLSTGSLLGGAQGGYRIGGGVGPPGGAGPVGISDYYSSRSKKEAREYQNPSRGVVGGGRNRMGRNRARW